jgi:ABC-2 type transport system ATP-binding protein
MSPAPGDAPALAVTGCQCIDRCREPVLQVERVTKTYGAVTALRGVDLEIAAGQVLGLVGRNGAGKTTLASIVAGLRRADGGRVRICGTDIGRHPQQARARLGFAPQQTGVYPTATVRENLALFGKLAGLRGCRLTAQVEAAAASMGLLHLMPRFARQLSGGESRRLHVATALVHAPDLLLLDEPTAGVDVQSRSALLQTVRALALAGTAVLYSTHYLTEIEDLDAVVAILHEGQVVGRGPVAELVRRHAGTHLELQFDGPAPALWAGRPGVETAGSTVRAAVPDPAAALAAALAELDGAAHRLRGVNIVRPSLEAVFLTLTGTPPDQEDRR